MARNKLDAKELQAFAQTLMKVGEAINQTDTGGVGPATMDLPNDWWIQKEFYEGLVLQRMDFQLKWMGFLPRTYSDAEGIVGLRNAYTADSDPAKRLPPLRASGSQFVRIGISELNEISTIMASRGFEFAISERATRYGYAVDEGLAMLKRAARWLAYFISGQVTSALADATTGVNRAVTSNTYYATTDEEFYNRTVVAWSSQDADPIRDMLMIQDDMEDISAGYTPTDYYVEKKSFNELRKALIRIDAEMDVRKGIFGLPDAKADSVFIPAVGATVHKMRYGLTHGDILAIDANQSPGNYYFGRNPRYNPPESVTDDEGEDIANNYGLHSHKYFNDQTHEDVIQMWLENAILIKDPFAGLFCPHGAKGI